MSSTTAALLKLPSSATCTKYSSCLRFMVTGPTPNRAILLLPFDTRLLDHLAPFVDIGLQPRLDLLRLAGPGLDAKLEQPRLHRGLGEYLSQGPVQDIHDLRRCAGRREQRIPGHHVVVGDAAFLRGRNIRRALRALRGGRGQRPDLTVGEVALHRRIAVD